MPIPFFRPIAPDNAPMPTSLPEPSIATNWTGLDAMIDHMRRTLGKEAHGKAFDGEKTANVGKSAIGVTLVDGLNKCWDGQVVNFDRPVNVCGVTYQGKWQAVMFPYRRNDGTAKATIQAIGPLGVPAPFARVAWQLVYFSATQWSCITGTTITNPFGKATVTIPKLPEVPNLLGHTLGGCFLNAQLIRGGTTLAITGNPPTSNLVSGAILVTSESAIVDQCPPVF